MAKYIFTVNGERTAANEGLWKFCFNTNTENLSLEASLGDFPLPYSLACDAQSDGKIIVSAYNIDNPNESRIYRVNADLSGFDSSFGTYALSSIDNDIPEPDPGDGKITGDGTFLYYAAYTSGLCVYSVDGSGNLTLKDSDTAATATSVVVVGDYVVVSCHDQGVKSYSIDGSGNITLVDTDDKGGFATDIWSDGTYIYVANCTRGIEVYTLDGAGNLVHLANYYITDAYIGRVYGDGTFLYASTYDTVSPVRIFVYAYSGATLTLRKTNDIGGPDSFPVKRMWSDGLYLYVTRSSWGMYSYSIAGDGTFTLVDVRGGTTDEYLWGLYGDSEFLYVGAYYSDAGYFKFGGIMLFKVVEGKFFYLGNIGDTGTSSVTSTYTDGTFVYACSSKGGIFSFSLGRVNYFPLGISEPNYSPSSPVYGVAVDPSDNSIWLSHYDDYWYFCVSKLDSDGRCPSILIDNQYSTIAWDVVFDSDFDAPIVGFDSDSVLGTLAVRYNKNTGAFIEGYSTVAAICRSVYASYPYVYLIREGVYAVLKYQTGVGYTWTSPVLTDNVMREVFKVGNYVVAGGALNASSKSLWLLSDTDGSNLDNYSTGGEVRGGFPIDDEYFVIVGQQATNEDAANVNVSVFKIVADAIQYVTGYTIGDSAEVMVNGILNPPIDVSGIVGIDAISGFQAIRMFYSGAVWNPFNYQLDRDRVIS